MTTWRDLTEAEQRKFLNDVIQEATVAGVDLTTALDRLTAPKPPTVLRAWMFRTPTGERAVMHFQPSFTDGTPVTPGYFVPGWVMNRVRAELEHKIEEHAFRAQMGKADLAAALLRDLTPKEGQ